MIHIIIGGARMHLFEDCLYDFASIHYSTFCCPLFNFLLFAFCVARTLKRVLPEL